MASGARKRRTKDGGAPRPAAPLAPVSGALAPTTLEALDARLALALGLAALVLFAVTACRTLYVGDAPELAMAAAVFGIPHPPGYPLFTLTTGLLVHLLPVDRALAANLVAALYAAVAVALAALFARRLGASRPAAAAGAICLSGGTTFWAQGTAIEVYGFDVMLALTVAHATLSAHRSPRALLVAVVAGSAWIGHRPLNLAYAPAFFLLARETGVALAPLLRRPAFVAAALSGALPFVWLPVRSATEPALDIGDPSTFDRFVTVVRGAPYARHWLARPLSLGVERLADHTLALPRELGVGALLAIAAIAVSPQRGVVRALVVVLAVNAAIVLVYHVPDIEAYFLPSSWALAILAALGLDLVATRAPRPARTAPLLAALSCGLVAVNFATHDLSAHTIVRRAAQDVLASADEGALVLVDGDTSIHALWYLQGVEGARPDVLVLSPGHISDWYLDELRARHPDEPWPGGLRASDPSRATASILRALGAHRPIYATPSVALDRYGAGGSAGEPFGSIPRGLGAAVLPVGSSVEVDEVAALDARIFPPAIDLLTPVPEVVDVDTASLYLEYALSMSRAAALVTQRHPELATTLWRGVIALEPDRHDREVAADARASAGLTLPPMELEAAARRALEVLEVESAR